jgi:hypothetical protein
MPLSWLSLQAASFQLMASLLASLLLLLMLFDAFDADGFFVSSWLALLMLPAFLLLLLSPLLLVTLLPLTYP